MSKRQTIRAWKDPEFRSSLNDTERSALPAHPAGLIELTDTELQGAAGGGSIWIPTAVCSVGCPGPSIKTRCTE
jgi:mersacidin/lichenicidin family type 2 lantibiotic